MTTIDDDPRASCGHAGPGGNRVLRAAALPPEHSATAGCGRGVVLITASIGALGLLAGCGGRPPVMTEDRREAVVADASSSPEQVVTAYIAALQDHDAKTAHALAVPRAQRQVVDPWLDHTPQIDDVRVAPAVTQDAPDMTGSSAEGYRSAVYVPVQFTLHGGDGSMPDGPSGWGYLLARNADSDPWRIVDNGVG